MLLADPVREAPPGLKASRIGTCWPGTCSAAEVNASGGAATPLAAQRRAAELANGGAAETERAEARSTALATPAGAPRGDWATRCHGRSRGASVGRARSTHPPVR